MGVVDDVQDRLQAQGLVDDGTWTSVRGTWHSKHDDRVVAISGDGGPTPDFPAAQGLGSGAIEDPGVQVMVRGSRRDRDATEAKAVAIKDDLHGLRGVTLGAGDYIRVRAMTPDPVFAGQDDDERPIYTIAFRLMRDHNL